MGRGRTTEGEGGGKGRFCMEGDGLGVKEDLLAPSSFETLSTWILEERGGTER